MTSKLPSSRGRTAIPVPRRPSGAAVTGLPVLGDRDRELLALLAEGRSVRQIAAAMAVTTNTTRTRIRRVQRKLTVADREQVVRAARTLVPA
ncbi:LuxR C-terminal-related transcriptional regulator [Blastococcus litoris]|uniref:LuxR C-terminal-related transcriptional regulator n=1 Tax=Blastococcus litoris TaxID=2171622 RepID=UPI000E309098|nr:LuxR C-terminal-related transcriptional regulator [Blastococcus litoris]